MAHILRRMARKFIRNDVISKLPLSAFRSSMAVSESSYTTPNNITSLKLASNADEVLGIIQQQAHTFTYKQLLLAMKTLFDLHKAGRLNFKGSIVNNQLFEILGQNLRKHARALEASDAIEALKILTHFRAPADSLMVQMMLQIIRCKINELNLSQVLFLDFLFSKLDPHNHLIDALKLALPLVFQIHLPLEQDNDDLPLLRKCLNFCCVNQMPDKFINNVVTGLILNDQRIDVETAKSVVWSLCQVDCSDAHATRAQLLHICYDVLARNMNALTLDTILKTGNVIKTHLIDKETVYYNETLMDAMANHFIEVDADFETSLSLGRILSRIAHTNLQLLDHICQKAVSQSNTLSSCSTHSLFGFINCLAYSNYTPDAETWEELKRQLSLNPLLEMDNAYFPWVRMCLEMLSLGIYDDRVLKKIFSEGYINDYLGRYHKDIDYVTLLTINEVVKTFYDQKYCLPDKILNKSKDSFPCHRVTGVIAEHVSKELGAPEFVAKDVLLPSGMVLDVVICLKDSCPVKICKGFTDNKIPLQELNIPDESTIVSIINLGPSCYSINSNRLRGTFRLTLDILERQGYITVALNREKWIACPPHERTPYLMQEISYKCAEKGVTFNQT